MPSTTSGRKPSEAKALLAEWCARVDELLGTSETVPDGADLIPADAGTAGDLTEVRPES